MKARPFVIEDAPELILKFGAREVRLTNLRKPFWKKRGITKRDLLHHPWLGERH